MIGTLQRQAPPLVLGLGASGSSKTLESTCFSDAT